jgi:ATP-binding cassette subfamily F protein 3
VLRHITNRIDPDDRIALVGVNGNGKSTFAKLLAGDLKPMGGEMRRSKGLEIAYFAQHQMDKLKPEQTPLEHVIALMPYDSEAKRRSRIAQMGLTTSRMDTLVKNLSGGERARLLLGLITFGGPGMLILDEPTNHLDIDSRSALMEAINDYGGAVILISHDRFLLEACADRLWLVANGGVKPFDDDLDAYRKLVLGGPVSPDRIAKAEEARASQADLRRDAASRRGSLTPLRKKIDAADLRMTKLAELLRRVDAVLGDPNTFLRDPATAAQLSAHRATLQSHLQSAEEEWLALSAEYEDALAG